MMNPLEIKAQKTICAVLQRLILTACKVKYPTALLEIDGIICISLLSSTEQHVVKIHEKVNTEVRVHEPGKNDTFPEINSSEDTHVKSLDSCDSSFGNPKVVAKPTEKSTEGTCSLEKSTGKLHLILAEKLVDLDEDSKQSMDLMNSGTEANDNNDREKKETLSYTSCNEKKKSLLDNDEICTRSKQSGEEMRNDQTQLDSIDIPAETNESAKHSTFSFTKNCTIENSEPNPTTVTLNSDIDCHEKGMMDSYSDSSVGSSTNNKIKHITMSLTDETETLRAKPSMLIQVKKEPVDIDEDDLAEPVLRPACQLSLGTSIIESQEPENVLPSNLADEHGTITPVSLTDSGIQVKIEDEVPDLCDDRNSCCLPFNKTHGTNSRVVEMPSNMSHRTVQTGVSFSTNSDKSENTELIEYLRMKNEHLATTSGDKGEMVIESMGYSHVPCTGSVLSHAHMTNEIFSQDAETSKRKSNSDFDLSKKQKTHCKDSPQSWQWHIVNPQARYSNKERLNQCRLQNSNSNCVISNNKDLMYSNNKGPAKTGFHVFDHRQTFATGIEVENPLDYQNNTVKLESDSPNHENSNVSDSGTTCMTKSELSNKFCFHNSTGEMFPRAKRKFTVNMRTPQKHEKKFFCTHCGEGFTKQSSRHRHERTKCEANEHKTEFMCNICGKSFPRRDSMLRHVQNIHHNHENGKTIFDPSLLTS